MSFSISIPDFSTVLFAWTAVKVVVGTWVTTKEYKRNRVFLYEVSEADSLPTATHGNRMVRPGTSKFKQILKRFAINFLLNPEFLFIKLPLLFIGKQCCTGPQYLMNFLSPYKTFPPLPNCDRCNDTGWHSPIANPFLDDRYDAFGKLSKEELKHFRKKRDSEQISCTKCSNRNQKPAYTERE